MSNPIPVYRKPKVSYEVMSNQSKTRKYMVCLGEVDWGRNGDTEVAVYTRILLFKNGQWEYQNYAAHILILPREDGKSDFDRVMEKMAKLKETYLVW